MILDNVKHLTLNGNSAIRLSIDSKTMWKGLPSGYKQLDYIECTGTQYIDTGFIPNQDSRIVCEFMYFSGNGIFGARGSVSSRNFSMRVINGEWQIGYGDGVAAGNIQSDTTNWHIADQNKNTLYIDGVFCVSRTYTEFSAPYHATIGAIKATSMYYGKGRYRGCQIYDNDTLIRDFIPCKDANGNIGMYDTVNAVFYKNAGSGEFVAGEEV